MLRQRPRAHPRYVLNGFSTGFTLLEILAAVAILAIAVVSLYSLQNQSIDLSGYVNEMTIATMMARERASEEDLKVRFPNLMSPKKPLSDEYPGFVIEDVPQEDSGLVGRLPEGIRPKPLGIRITWKHRGREETLTLRGYLPVQ